MQQPILKVSLRQLQQNIEFFKEQTTAQFCAVVKADAYGHGAANIALFIEDFVDYFAVATVQEGVQLRLVGIKKPILVFTPAMIDIEVLEILHYNLIASITDMQDYMLLCKIASIEGKVLSAHIKVNTGMNRYGFNMQEFKNFCNLKFCDNIQIEGIYSHFYYTKQLERTRRQFTQFMKFVSHAEKNFGKLLKHISATGSFFIDKRYHLDIVRIGLGIYGYLPDGEHKKQLQPIMQLYANVMANREFTGGGTGYSTYRPKNNALATFRLGYADGLLYKKTENIPPCMDCQVIEGDFVKYQQIQIVSDFEEYAKKNKTIVYQILTTFGNRIEREYLFDL